VADVGRHVDNVFQSNIYTVFFFSSRRRHTRFSRDWSSDVCSSDLRSGSAARCTARSRRSRAAIRMRRPAGRSAHPDCCSRASAADRKSVVEGKRVDCGGGGVMKKETEYKLATSSQSDTGAEGNM